jgi:hypothetical protein
MGSRIRNHTSNGNIQPQEAVATSEEDGEVSDSSDNDYFSVADADNSENENRRGEQWRLGSLGERKAACAQSCWSDCYESLIY